MAPAFKDEEDLEKLTDEVPLLTEPTPDIGETIEKTMSDEEEGVGEGTDGEEEGDEERELE